VGLEDNLHFDRDRRQLATNAELLQRVHRLMNEMQYRSMSGSEFRTAILGAPGPSPDLTGVSGMMRP
jgi:uncharacterized protein (DUF849 family)